MGADHFLEHGFVLDDHFTQGLQHGLELYSHGGELFLRLWIGGAGANMPVICRVTPKQAREIAEGSERLATRFSV